jgi:two-component system, chemotaxis family, chemotaxis protein CheY
VKAQYSVLVIDDSPFIFKAVKRALEPEGYHVVDMAENGQIGMEMVEKYNPDIITLDVTMPIQDGLQTAKLLSEIKLTGKVIMMSAMGDEDIVEQARQAGINHFLKKPFKPQELLIAIKNILGEVQ